MFYLIQSMVIAAEPPVAMAGSHHRKFLERIRQSNKSLSNSIWDGYQSCIAGVAMPSEREVGISYICSVAEAKKRGLLTSASTRLMGALGSNLVAGSDGFLYKLAMWSDESGVYSLSVRDAPVTPALLSFLRQSNGRFDALGDLISAILDEMTPTFRLANCLHAGGSIFNDVAAFLPQDGRRDTWAEMSHALEHALYARGYLPSTYILTKQEHELQGNAVPDVHSRHPHRPYGLLLSATARDFPNLTPEALEAARELQVFTHACRRYCGLSGEGHLPAALGPLDEHADSAMDPRPIDAEKVAKLGNFLRLYPLEEAISKCLIPGIVKSSDFPYRRD
jgi:hypothetical protein